jgi:Helix-turn-helix family
MSIPFGPQLIGQTEKTLVALLLRYIEGVDLTEPQWVTLRVASDGSQMVGTDALVAAVADRAQLSNASDLVCQLSERGLLADGRLTPAGSELIASVQARMTTNSARIWGDLPADDVAAATRVLNEVLERARAALPMAASA